MKLGGTMATPIEDAAVAIDTRIEELRGELARLERAKQALTEINGDRPRRRESSNSAPRRAAGRRAKPGSRPDRAAQLKDVVAKQPGIRPSQAAEQMGVSSQQVHGVIKRLVDKGELTRSAKGLQLAKAERTK
jgi:polyhydroxyalkanoate synthesis regulator phasin